MHVYTTPLLRYRSRRSPPTTPCGGVWHGRLGEALRGVAWHGKARQARLGMAG